MKPLYPACGLAAVVLIFGPVAYRVWSWQRAVEPPVISASMAKSGEVLFKHEWTVNDPLCPNGDGLGPVFNARSCVACHNQGGVGGAGELKHNVTTYQVLPETPTGQRREGVVHTHATAEKFRETLTHVDASLPGLSLVKMTQIVNLPNSKGQELLTIPSNVRLSQRQTPALFGTGLIDLIPERVILANERLQKVKYGMAPGTSEAVPVGRVHRLANGKIGRFGWKGHTASLAAFVQAACANELGLGNPTQPQPLSLGAPSYYAPGLDLTQQQCDDLTAFVAALPRPIEKAHPQAAAGKALFNGIGCTQCHTPTLGNVNGIYSDLLLHRMGPTLEGGAGYYGGPPPDIATPSVGIAASDPLPDEWRTPPLWGVADSAPYLHDGRAATLTDAIKLHGGQAKNSAEQFERLRPAQQAELIAFLQTLKAP